MLIAMVTLSELVDIFVENKLFLDLTLVGGDSMASSLLEYFRLFGEVFARIVVSRCVIHECSETGSEVVHLVGWCFYTEFAHFIGFIKYKSKSKGIIEKDQS